MIVRNHVVSVLIHTMAPTTLTQAALFSEGGLLSLLPTDRNILYVKHLIVNLVLDFWVTTWALSQSFCLGNTHVCVLWRTSSRPQIKLYDESVAVLDSPARIYFYWGSRRYVSRRLSFYWTALKVPIDRALLKNICGQNWITITFIPNLSAALRNYFYLENLIFFQNDISQKLNSSL